MKCISTAAVGGLLWLTFSAVAFGDTLIFSAQTENVDNGGQFSATLASNPSQTLLVYCVDYANDLLGVDAVNISTPNPSVSPDEGLVLTRYGQTPTADFSFYNSGTGTLASGTAPLTAFQRYVLAGWLITQYNFSSGVTTADKQIQNGIWTLLTVNGTSGFPFGDAAGDGNYITLAEQWLGTELATPAGMANLAAFESDIRIYTSTNTIPYTGPGTPFVSGNQEMIGITGTPEPATLAMLGGGLLGIGLFRKRFKA
jgi:PEP-CTERM motif